MQLIAGLLYLVVLVYMIMLITRLVLEWIRAYAREYFLIPPHNIVIKNLLLS